jgi:diguanylate cyclase (GGDEF)-like protein/PAS domain S-box-containing protein
MDAPDSDPRLMGVLRISRVVGCLSEEHGLRLVALAVAICAVACFTALNMLSRRDGAGRAAQTGWLVGAGLAFGCGVWTTHFVAMLAFWPPLPVGYEVATTTLSFAVSSVGALAALGVFATAPRRAAAVAPAGLLLGGSVGAMHFVGMDAMRFPGEVRFDPGLTAASVLLGAVLAVVGLGCGARLERLSRRIAGAACLALAILGLHLTAMAAVQIVSGAPGPHATADGEVVLASGPLAIAVAAVGGLILLLSLFGSVVDQHLCARAAAEAARLRQLAGCSFEGIVIHSGGVVLDVNPAFCRLADRPAGELVGRHALDLVAPEDAIVVRRRLRTPTPEPAELSLLTRDGGRRRVEILSRPIEYDGRPAAVVAVRDLSDRRRAEEQIRRLAHHDALTGLPNRVLLNYRLAQALELAVPAGEGLAVLCLDLDRFKGVNDLLGHQGGDRLLVQVAERLRRAVRAMDTVARLGGDEFAVVQPLAAQPGAAAVLARRLVEILAEPFEIDGHQIAIGASVGIASHPADGASAAALLRRADIALYRAKRDGRGTFHFFEPAMDRRLRERRSVEQDLRRAIDLGQLELSFQPMVECRTGGTVGFEALARWNTRSAAACPPGSSSPPPRSAG